MEQYVEATLRFIEAHPDWIGGAIFLAAFGESLVVVGLFVPGTAILAASGVLVPLGIAHFELLLICGAAGAFLGDCVSYWLGRYAQSSVLTAWLSRRHPTLIAKGTAFCTRYGAAAILLGRFFGPLRAIVPFSAGALGMPTTYFLAANAGSALVWVAILVGSTAAAGKIIELAPLGRLPSILSVLAIVAIVVLAAMAIARRGRR